MSRLGWRAKRVTIPTGLEADIQYLATILPGLKTDTYPRLRINLKLQPPNPNDILRKIIPYFDLLLGRSSAGRFVDDRSGRAGQSSR